MPTLTPAQVAEDLQISTATILRYMKSGNMPDFKVGARWRIEERDFEAWKEARKIESGSWDPYRVEPGSAAHLAIVTNATARASDPWRRSPQAEAQRRRRISREGG